MYNNSSERSAPAGTERRRGNFTQVPDWQIRLMLKWRAEGASLREIGRRLDGNAPTALGGGRWYASTVRSVLLSARAQGLDA